MSVNADMSVRVRLMRAGDIERVLRWRSHPDVRRYMYTQQQEIGLAEHTSWFERASQDVSRQRLIVECEGAPLGFVNLHTNTFHRRLGFRREAVLHEQHFDGQRHHDVVCFGLLADEWAVSFRMRTK